LNRAGIRLRQNQERIMKGNFTSTQSIDRSAAERAAIERWEGEGGRAPEIEERASRSGTYSMDPREGDQVIEG
jgi:hypothetical protein